MSRLLCILLALLILIFPFAVLAETEDETQEISMEEGIQKWLDELDLFNWEKSLSDLSQEAQSLLGFSSVKDLIDHYAKHGSVGLSTEPIRIKRLLLVPLKSCTKNMSFYILMALLSGLLQGISGKDALGSGEAASFFLRCIALLSVFTVFMRSAGALWHVTDQAASFLEIALPSLLLLLTAIGGNATCAALQPSALLLTGSLVKIIQSVILPLALLGGVSGILDKLFSTSRMQELSRLFTKTAKWMMGIVSTLFIGSTTIRGLAAASFDGVTLRSAKYAAGSLIPIVGGMVSGTMDTMLGCAQLVKSGAGIAALLIICAMVIIPLIKAVGIVFTFRIAAAFSQPLNDKRLSMLMGSAADGLSLLIGITVGAGLVNLSFVTLLILIGSAGL